MGIERIVLAIVLSGLVAACHFEPAESKPPTSGEIPDLAPHYRGLTRNEAQDAIANDVGGFQRQLQESRAAGMNAKAIWHGAHCLRWLETEFGSAPEGKRSLWISLHGGGDSGAEVNDQQWRNQLTLYQPGEGIYVAPRAPTDTWNMWHEGHIDPLFERLIDDFVALRGVDPDRVYLLGYSAGGDGVWQVAPRMADRFAAAAMMAGHPNDASLLSLRDLPFAIFMGADDSAYERNKVARERATQLDELQRADPAGYEHFVRIYEGLGHWMQKKDAEALPWMANHTRIAWPKKSSGFRTTSCTIGFIGWAELPGLRAPVKRSLRKSTGKRSESMRKESRACNCSCRMTWSTSTCR